MTSPFMRRVKERGTMGHGRKAEDSFARRVRGNLQPASGAMAGAKGDVVKDTSSFSFLVENKATKTKTMSIQRDWCLKIYQEALEQDKVPALAFQFTTDAGHSEKRERWVAVPEHIWKELVE